MNATTTSYQIDLLKTTQAKELAEGQRIVRLVKLSQMQVNAEGKKVEIAEDAKGCIIPSLSSSFANAFVTKYPELIASYLESVQDKLVREVWIKSRRSPTVDDLSIDKIGEYLQVNEAGDRLTGEQVKAAYKSSIRLALVNVIAKLRNIDLNVEDNVAMVQGIADNYLPYLMWAVARKPIWSANTTEGMRTKILAVMSALMEATESPIVVRAVEKMMDAPIAQVDESAY